VAAVAHVLLVRSGDALFERVVAARLTRVDKVLTIGRSQLRDPATARIGLVPHRDIAVGKGLRVTHDILRAKELAGDPSGQAAVWLVVAGKWLVGDRRAMTREVKMWSDRQKNLDLKRHGAAAAGAVGSAA